VIYIALGIVWLLGALLALYALGINRRDGATDHWKVWVPALLWPLVIVFEILMFLTKPWRN